MKIIITLLLAAMLIAGCATSTFESAPDGKLNMANTVYKSITTTDPATGKVVTTVTVVPMKYSAPGLFKALMDGIGKWVQLPTGETAK